MEKNTGGCYMAVVSLLEELQQHLSPNNLISPFSKREIHILHDAVTSMHSLLTHSSGLTYNYHLINQISENRILSLAQNASKYLDFWTVKLNLWNLFKPIREIPSLAEITQEMIAINHELNIFHHSSSTDNPSSWLIPLTTTVNPEAKMIGLENEFVAMLDCLTGHPSKLKVFPIIGMAGVGKTTFSNKLYHNPLVVHHFYIRAWVTVSQQYQVRKILLTILNCVANEDSFDLQGRSEEELEEKVYRILKQKRYLLVLDDMWDTKAWDELKRVFPDDKNGSRIILTSRLQEVAVHASEDTPAHCLRCLSMHESWELLSSKIFVGGESCPQDMVEVGKQIAYKCHGLPLTIVVLGGLLSKMNKKIDVWESVAQSVRSLVMEEADQCRQTQHILALSYNHLPDSLKPCFLYMGMFPEDYEISVKKLTWLWVAEGFIRSTTHKSLEEIAEDYLADLIARSLILVKRRSSRGTVKTCYIHDLMRELCLRESQKHNFLHAINGCGQLRLHVEDMSGVDLPPDFGEVPPPYLHDLQRLSFHSSIHEYSNKASFPYTRSLMSFEKLSVSGHRRFLGMSFKLLKVLNIVNTNLMELPGEIMMLTRLKFLALTIQSSLDIRNLSEFRLLQTLFIDCEWDGYLIRTFWDMLELRHFHMKRSCQSYLSTYSLLSQSQLPLVSAVIESLLPLRLLNNLSTVSTVRPISCTEKMLRSMPHLKSLGVYESEEDYQFRGWFERLVLLPELEKLKYVFSNPFVSSSLKPGRLPPWQSLPPNLVKLTLSGTSLPWDDMSKLSMLPKLEVLKLKNYAFSGTVWNSWTGGFCCLKFLLIGSTNLEIWETDGNHFPNLRQLVLRHCRFLEEIPYGIGESPLLETIELHRCKNSAVISARSLQEEQQSLGNDGLTIYITEG
ncbi:putative late blight resistance protein homolog R1A-10 isoform X2 [Salvia splendens]|uniref:putative late blight resistance protein homolog R1A-10 isoform X2 n=1 Tax=Salvia splendens TaxID=180675 RepID=UPI001C25ADB7|nr:putative late blight resistance protein homolog R1A-10 isoform X2 [Salvia splendens]